MQPAVALNEVDDVGGAFLYAVADDEQQKFTAPEVARNTVDEFRLVQIGVMLPDQFVERIALPARGHGHPALQVLVSPRSEVLGVVEDLSDNFAPRLGIAPQLELGECQPAQMIDVERIQIAGGSGQLAANGDGFAVSGVDGGNGKCPWETEQQVLEGVLADSALEDARVQRNALQHFLDDAVAGIEPDQIALYVWRHRFASSETPCNQVIRKRGSVRLYGVS